jgi:hypothetical protein
MALPKLSTPTYELEIPSSKEQLTYRPFLVKEEKLLLLANESDDEQEMINAMKNIIINCTFGDLSIDELALFDLEYIFLKIRSKSVGEIVELELLCEDDGETRVPVKINLDEVQVTFNEKHTNKLQLTDQVGILMKYPQVDLMTTQSGGDTEYVFKMIRKCISQIYEGEVVHERADFNDKELDEFIESLDTQQFQKVQSFFETMPKLSHTVKFKNPNTKKFNNVTLEGMQSFFE